MMRSKLLKRSAITEATLTEAMDFRQRENPADQKFYSKKVNGDIVAMVQVYEEDFGYSITGVRTAAKHQRQGHMEELLNHILFVLYPDSKFMLEVESKNVGAITLYKKLGFKFGKETASFDNGTYRTMRLERK